MRLLVLCLVWLAWVLALPFLCVWRWAARARPGTYLLFEVDGAVDEIPAPRRWWRPSPVRALSLLHVGRVLDDALRDPDVRGVVLVLRAMHGGFATASALRRVLARVRAAGKRVIVHLPHGGGTKETYVAAAADFVVLGSQAMLAPLGVLAATPYFRTALDRAGVVPDVYACGRYKTAAEPIERAAMSEAQREQLGAALDGVHAEVVRALREGRGLDAARARAALDQAPYGGDEAVRSGLVDAVAYDDELSARVEPGAPSAVRVRSAFGYARPRRVLRGPRGVAAGVIAVIRVHGPIASVPNIALPRMALEEQVIAAVRLARRHPRVRGVIVHVDSPGGSALASDRIHHEVERLAAVKPVVACMGDVAASGGYYVAAAAHEIVAQPVTITGSIGVIMARVVLAPLLARIGVNVETLQRGARARLLHPFLPLDDADRDAIRRELERSYRAFLHAVARGRALAVERVERLAEGRIYTGEDARSVGLVDRLGGLDDALEAVRARIGPGGAGLRVAVVRPPRRSPPWPDAAEAHVRREAGVALEAAAHLLELDPACFALAHERVLAWSPAAGSLRG